MNREHRRNRESARSASSYDFPIFVSSTAYDLVDLRAELEQFLTRTGYHPILSSSDGFPSTHSGAYPWEQCLDVLSTCFVVALVIDGRYGASLEWPNYPNLANGEKISATHGEYRYAMEKRLRTMVFVRTEVMSQYQNYRAARRELKNDEEEIRKRLYLPKHIEFGTMKFVHEVKTTGNPIPWITTFDDVTQIKTEIQHQLTNELARAFRQNVNALSGFASTLEEMMCHVEEDKRKAILLDAGLAAELVEKIESYQQDRLEIQQEYIRALKSREGDSILQSDEDPKLLTVKGRMDMVQSDLKRLLTIGMEESSSSTQNSNDDNPLLRLNDLFGEVAKTPK